MNNEIILLSINGEDKPGISSSLTDILAQYGAQILDIGQSVIHQQLNLGIMFRITDKSVSAPILKDLLFKAYELGVHAKFSPVDVDEYEEWVAHQGKERYIITMIAREINALQLSKVTDLVYNQSLNIDIITRLTGRPSIKKDSLKNKSSVELSLRGNPVDELAFRNSLMKISQETGVDIAFQKDNIYRRTRRLVCFDMDSTLIQTEVIVELAKRHGVGDQVHEITEAAMRGELDFNESFIQRVALLKGLDENVMFDIARNLPITEGAETLFRNLRKYGFKTAILSGGFNYFGRFLQHKLGIDYVFSNELEIKNGKLTGKHLGEIVNGEMKAELLKKIAFKEDIHLEQVVAIGDGANDLPMLNVAGLGIAFHAKQKVKENAKNSISTIGLDAILYLMGFRDREIDG
ncbi:MAG: phosphoserine phosphatase SerB [Bacteroidales bacterium]|nr:phosphoserine phosphatase SerB [Bacteroidales bacterium]